MVNGFKLAVCLLPILVGATFDKTNEILKIESRLLRKGVLAIIPKIGAVKGKSQRAVAVNQRSHFSVSERNALVPIGDAVFRKNIVLFF